MSIFIGRVIAVTVVSAVFASNAFAVATKASARCPRIDHGSDRVINYGNIAAGVGRVKIEGQRDMLPYFNGYILPGLNIPQNLSNYKNDTVRYNPVNGGIICNYKSSIEGEDAFAISYLIPNATGGVVAHSTNEKIYFKLKLG